MHPDALQTPAFAVVLLLALCPGPVAALQTASIVAPDQTTGLQHLELTPEAQARLDTGWPDRVRIIDRNDRVMPMQRETLTTSAPVKQVAVARYAWPSQTGHWREPDRALLRLQLERGDARAILTLPPDSTAAPPDPAAQTSAVWLLKPPALEARDGPDDGHLRLEWASAQGTRVHAILEGSDDLSNWTPLDQRDLVQAQGVNPGDWIEQKELAVRPQRYWRLTLSQPLALTAVTWLQPAHPQPLWREHPVPVQAVGSGEWHMDLGAPWPVQAVRVVVPPGHVWAVALDLREAAGLNDPRGWQNVAQGTLTSSPPRHTQAGDTLRLEPPRTAQFWRLTSQNITQTPQVRVVVQRQRLWFLAQGQGPYRLQIAAPHEASWHNQASPELQDMDAPKATAALQLSDFVEKNSLWRHAFWAIIGIGVLALLALVVALGRNMPPAPNPKD